MEVTTLDDKEARKPIHRELMLKGEGKLDVLGFK